MDEFREKILIVDDEKIIINVFKICLAKDGNIESAFNPFEHASQFRNLCYNSFKEKIIFLGG